MIHKILEIYAGSHSYGTNIESSDVDKRGIFTLDEKSIITKHNYIDEVEGKEPDDYRYYEFSKFSDLLSKQNPNIMEILWTEQPHIISLTPAGQLLRSQRDKLLTTQVKNTYVEYALSQLKRIKGHNKMIMKPQDEKAPQIKNFVKISYNFTNNPEFNKSLPENGYVLYKHDAMMIVAFDVNKFLKVFPQMKPNTGLFLDDGALRLREQGEFSKLKSLGVKPDILLSFNRENYEKQIELWRQYWSWVKNRNPARSALEIAHGYDTKHAMHVIRLLRSGYEILSQSRVNVYRQDAKELLDIRNGKWSYEHLLEQAQELQENIKNVKTSLPDSIDKDFLSSLTFEVYKEAWKEMGLKLKKTNKI